MTHITDNINDILNSIRNESFANIKFDQNSNLLDGDKLPLYSIFKISGALNKTKKKDTAKDGWVIGENDSKEVLESLIELYSVNNKLSAKTREMIISKGKLWNISAVEIDKLLKKKDITTLPGQPVNSIVKNIWWLPGFVLLAIIITILVINFLPENINKNIKGKDVHAEVTLKNLIDNYHSSLERQQFDAMDYFASAVKIYYNLKDLTPLDINTNYSKQKGIHLNPKYIITNNHIDISYRENFYELKYEGTYISFRTNKGRYLSAKDSLKLRINKNFKIFEIIETKVWDVIFLNSAQLKELKEKEEYNVSPELECWNNVNDQKVLSAYVDYSTSFPNGIYIREAEQNIEDMIWHESVNENTEQAFKNYLTYYPTGKYFKEATSLLELIKKKNEHERTENIIIPGKYPFTSLRYLTSSDLVHLNKMELKIMRNEIFARYGYVFKTKEMKVYFDKQDWYIQINKVENNNEVMKMLTGIESRNIITIQKFEKNK